MNACEGERVIIAIPGCCENNPLNSCCVFSLLQATAATLTIASYIKVRELQQKALEEAASALGL